jgi:hypothetical protein
VYLQTREGCTHRHGICTHEHGKCTHDPGVVYSQTQEEGEVSIVELDAKLNYLMFQISSIEDKKLIIKFYPRLEKENCG